MTSPIPLQRRTVLAWGGGTALLSMSMTSCGFLSTDPDQVGGDDGDGPLDVGAREAPMLQQRVETGELPALAERLPSNPLIVEVPQPGSYGGTWRAVTLGPGDGAAFQRITGYQPLMRKDVMLTETVPNLCTEVQVNEAGTEYTLALRDGVRWSDGEPFSADDIVFAIESVWGNTELNPSPPRWLSTDGELAAAEKVDDTTVKITFPAPNGIFAETLPTFQGVDLLRFPEHYVSRFLPDTNKVLKQEVKDEGFEAWTDYFDDRAGGDARWSNIDLPVLEPWKTTEPLGEGSQVVLERNPYFWKTDPDGRQLPYIDRLSFEVVTDQEVMVLKGADGELDLIYRHVNSPANKPVFAKGREAGDYQLAGNKAAAQNTMIISLNLANKNPAHRELYRNKDFRIGLSHAIDRQELINAVWQRQGEPWQCGPTADSAYYDEEFAKQYTEFDVALADAHLDKAGITERDRQGYRKLANGKQLTINLDIATALFEEWPTAGAMIKDMWQKVGIRLNLNVIDRTLFYDRKTASANQHDAGVWFGSGGLGDEIIDPRWYLPFSDESIFATTWAQWFASRGHAGEEPVAAAKKQIELYWELERTPAQADREELFRQILEIGRDEFWAIGIGTYPEPYLVIKNRLKNVITGIPDTWVYLSPAHNNPEMWFIQDGA